MALDILLVLQFAIVDVPETEVLCFCCCRPWRENLGGERIVGLPPCWSAQIYLINLVSGRFRDIHYNWVRVVDRFATAKGGRDDGSSEGQVAVSRVHAGEKAAVQQEELLIRIPNVQSPAVLLPGLTASSPDIEEGPE